MKFPTNLKLTALPLLTVLMGVVVAGCAPSSRAFREQPASSFAQPSASVSRPPRIPPPGPSVETMMGPLPVKFESDIFLVPAEVGATAAISKERALGVARDEAASFLSGDVKVDLALYSTNNVVPLAARLIWAIRTTQDSASTGIVGPYPSNSSYRCVTLIPIDAVSGNNLGVYRQCPPVG